MSTVVRRMAAPWLAKRLALWDLWNLDATKNRATTVMLDLTPRRLETTVQSRSAADHFFLDAALWQTKRKLHHNQLWFEISFFSPQMFCVWVKTVRYDSSFTDTNRYRRFRRGVYILFFFQNRGVRVKINHVLEWTRYYYVPSCPSSLVCIRTLHRLKSTFVSSAFTYKWTASKYRSWIIALSPLERYLAIFYCS